MKVAADTTVVDDGNEAVRYEVIDNVAWLTIDRANERNALSREVREGLWRGIRRFNEDSHAGVLILIGAGDRAFCAGGNLKEMADTSLTIPPPDYLPNIGRNIEVAKVTIAAVNGVAYAGGFLLAQMCDLVVAADTARFAITEAKVGRGAPWAIPLPWLIPPRIAMELLVTGESIDAARAHAIGLVNRVVPLTDLRAAASDLAHSILANAPLSVQAAKRTVHLAAGLNAAQVFQRADEIWAPVYASEDAQEGPSAFRDKRPPKWKGR
jgi:enoyl-CoA hydratase/carnithine racemase